MNVLRTDNRITRRQMLRGAGVAFPAFPGSDASAFHPAPREVKT